ncbi:hypothetical protein CRN77_15365 [Proteus vulgaris]|nr:hypothetical protein CRN77_15365 [Proteus vulgaris]
MSNINEEKIIEHLTEKWKGTYCPLCKSGPWNVSDKVFELREFQKDGGIIIGGGPIIPIIPVTCSNCGHIVLVNAIVSGCMPPDSKDGR